MARGLVVAVFLVCTLIVVSVDGGSVYPQGITSHIEAALHKKVRDQCTMIAVAQKASADGSTMATHTNDCYDCDFRLGLVKGKLHGSGEKRPVAPARFQYPRYIGLDRGDTFTPERVSDTQVYPWPLTPTVAYIPQAEQTYNFLDGSYGLINEWQVGMGESTCSAKLVNVPKHDGGNATFDLGELTRIAMARSKTAREAIRIMGELGVAYGFYGAEWKGPGMYGEAGEGLMVTDPHEAWVFHILPDGTDRSAVYCAQRIPDEHVAVVANEFIIGEVDCNDSDNFLCSDNIIDVAVKHKFWDPASGKPFNFRLAYSQPEFHVHHQYSDRRNWRVMDLVAPSHKFPSDSSLDTLPFSVKPDVQVSHFDLFRIQRDHYEGTEFDLTKGIAAESHGNPNRYDAGWASGVPIEFLIEGNFERAISIHRTSYAIVTQSRHWLPREVGGMVWFGAAHPHATAFLPFYPSSTHVAKSYQEGSLWKFRRESAWWAYASVGNWMEKNFHHMSEDVGLMQRRTERTISDERSGVETEASQLIRAGRVLEGRAMITDWSEKKAEETTAAWWDLFEHLITRYLNGARIDDWHANVFSPTSLFYPFEWLKSASYWPADMDFTVAGPKPVHVTPASSVTADKKKDDTKKPAPTVTTTLVDNSSPALVATPSDVSVPASVSSSSSVGTIMGAALLFAAGLICGRVWQKRSDAGYSALPTSSAE